MSSRMQIDRFAVENFRAIQQCDVELSPVTFFIGANASGKTSYVDALMFLQQALRESLERAVRIRGGSHSIVHHPLAFPTEAHFHLDISSSINLTCAYDLILRFQDSNSVIVVREECRIQDPDGKQHYYLVANGTVQGTAAIFPPVSADRLFLTNASGLPEFRAFFDFLAGVTACETIMPSFHTWAQEFDQRARNLDPTRAQTGLAPRFRRIGKDQPQQLEIIQQYLRFIAPPFEKIEITESQGMSWLRFVEKFPSGERMPFYVPQASAGLVNAADILLELFDLSSTSPVIVEEPEALLHPGAIHVMRDAFLEASKIRQVLVTTHSPDLLDDDSVPAEWIRTVYRNEAGTHIQSLDDGTKSVIRDHLYTPGQLLRQGGLITTP